MLWYEYWWNWGGGGLELTGQDYDWSPLGGILRSFHRTDVESVSLYVSVSVHPCTNPGNEDQSPFRTGIPQTVVFIWALLVVTLSEVVLPTALIVFTLAGFLGLGAGRESKDGVEAEKYRAPPAAH